MSSQPLPLTLNVQALASAMLAKAGLKSVFHLMITIAMGMLEGAVKLPMHLIIIIDRSGSTGKILDSGESILQTAKNAAQVLIQDFLTALDLVTIIDFGSDANVALRATKCDPAGQAQASNAIDGIRCSGGTAYSIALNLAKTFINQDSGRKTAVIFFTDGDNAEWLVDPVAICQELTQMGATVYIGGLGVSNEGEKLLEKMSGTNFKSLSNAQEVIQFFAGAQAQAASALITNARLQITPVFRAGPKLRACYARWPAQLHPSGRKR